MPNGDSANGSSGKESACCAGDTGDMRSIPVSERYPEGGNGNPHQYSCLENLMNRGAWGATATKSQTQLSMHALLPHQNKS